MSWQWLLDIAWLLFLLLLLQHFWRERSALKKTQSWYLASGKITRLTWTQEGHYLWPRLEYTYHAFNQEFYGEQLFLETAHHHPGSKYARKVAYRAAMAYQKEEAIEVYYNPQNPQEAALDISIPSRLTFIIRLLLILIALHFLIVIYRLW